MMWIIRGDSGYQDIVSNALKSISYR